MVWNLYNFQKLVIFLNIFPTLFKITSIILSFYDKRNSKSPDGNYLYENGNFKIIYVVNSYLVPIGILIYLILITIRSSINLALKNYMDKIYISEFFILMVYGLMGTIISIIFCIITTYSKCVEGIEIKENFKYGHDYVCIVQEPNSNFTKLNKYIANFKIYLNDFNTTGEIITEIIIVILKIVSFFLQKNFTLKIIKHLTPIHVIFSFPIYYFCQKSLAILKTLIIEKRIISKKHINFIYEKLTFDMSSDILAFIGFLIYIEIIELKFGNLDYYLRKNILKRIDEQEKEQQKQSQNQDSKKINKEENIEENP